MQAPAAVAAALAKSKFRSRFKLTAVEAGYLAERSPEEIRLHAQRIIGERLAPADLDNDGRQTPMRGHPVFVAQHATATCCRTCLNKWYGVDKERPMTASEIAATVDAITTWIEQFRLSADQFDLGF